MSHEIVLIAGEAKAADQERRRRVVDHAASLMPGAVDWSIHENQGATLALVTTMPAGGTVALVDTQGGGTRVVVGGSEQAVKTAFSARHRSQDCGAEAGHLLVNMRHDGAITVECDGVGFIPCFWSWDQRELRLTTHLASIVSLGARAEMDEVGAVEYLTMLHPLLNRTLLRNVQLLPAGGRLEQRTDARPLLHVDRLFTPSDDRMTDDQAVDEFTDIWTRVIDDLMDRAGDRCVGLGLSGGLDSRAIAVGCADADRRPFAFTYGTATSVEGKVATALAGELEYDHVMLPVTAHRQLFGARDAIALLDGAHSPAEMYEMWFSEFLKNFDVLINGLAGGPLWGDDKAIGLVGTERIVDSQMHKHRAELSNLRSVLAPNVAAESEGMIREGLRESMQEWDMSARSDMVIFWRIHNRQFRWGNALTNVIRRLGIRAEGPFLDSRVLAYCSRLTPAQRLNGNLHLRVHREVFSRAAKIPRGNDGCAPEHLNHAYWSGESPYLRQLVGLARTHPISAGRRAARQAERIAIQKAPAWPALESFRAKSLSRRDVFPADLWMETSPVFGERLLGLLGSSPTASLFDSQALTAAAEDLRRGQAPFGPLLVAKIATLQAWFADFTRREAQASAIE